MAKITKDCGKVKCWKMANYGAEFQRVKEYEKRLYNRTRDFLCKEWLEKKTGNSCKLHDFERWQK